MSALCMFRLSFSLKSASAIGPGSVIILSIIQMLFYFILLNQGFHFGMGSKKFGMSIIDTFYAIFRLTESRELRGWSKKENPAKSPRQRFCKRRVLFCTQV